VPRVPPKQIEGFTFKCRLCMIGFQRRGMLVNHLSKKHPELNMAEVCRACAPYTVMAFGSFKKADR